MRLPLILSAFIAASPAAADVPRVMTDLPAIHSLTAQVMGDLGAPDILLEKGSDAHHFQLRPSQARGLTDADLVIWVGPEMTPWLARAIEGVQPEGDTLELIHLDVTHRQDFGAAQDMHDHAEEHDDHGDHDDHDDHDDHAEHDDHGEHSGHDDQDDHAEHAEEGHDDHNHKGMDPHAWLTPENGAAWLKVIAAELSRLDPDNAQSYAANAEKALAGLEQTEARIRQVLAPVGDAPIMVFHDAYGYFAAHFDVNIAGSIALGDAAAPGARRLSEMHEILEHKDAVCVFPEAQHDPAYVRTVVEGTGVRVGGVLDPSGTTLDYGPGLYDALLTGIAQSIADCVTAD